MNGRRAVVGLSLLCALVFCAYAAPNASAGRTLVTCVKGEKGTQDFNDQHCTQEAVPGHGEYGHEVIKETATEYETSNILTVNEPFNAVLKGTISKEAVEIVCGKVGGGGTAQNKEILAVMYNVGSKINYSYSECTVPTPKGCKVKGGKFELANMKSLTFEEEEGLGWGVKYEPTEGTKLGEVVLEGCTNKELNKAQPIEGNLRAIPEGATTSFLEEVTGKGLKLAKEKATLSCRTTMRMKETEGKQQNPLAYTKTIP